MTTVIDYTQVIVQTYRRLKSPPEVHAPLKTIRLKCLDCSAGSPKEVRICPVTTCPLWPYRMGKRPTTLAQKSPELLDRAEVYLAGQIAYSREEPGEGWFNAGLAKALEILDGERDLTPLAEAPTENASCEGTDELLGEV